MATQQPLLYEGFMTKQGGQVKSWKKRYFVLHAASGDSPALLSYYKSQKDVRKPIDDIKLTTTTRIQSTGPTQFELHTEQRTYFLVCDAPDEQRGWVEHITKVIGDHEDDGSLQEAFMLKHHGYLWKQTGLMKRWEVRYCVLNPWRIVLYKDSSMDKPVSAINVNTCIDITSVNSNMFTLNTQVKSHQFASDNAAELDNWVAVLNNAIDFNRLHGGGLAVPLPNSLIIDPNATEPLDNRTVRGQSSVPLYNARKVPLSAAAIAAMEQVKREAAIASDASAGAGGHTSDGSSDSEHTLAPPATKRRSSSGASGGNRHASALAQMTTEDDLDNSYTDSIENEAAEQAPAALPAAPKPTRAPPMPRARTNSKSTLQANPFEDPDQDTSDDEGALGGLTQSMSCTSLNETAVEETTNDLGPPPPPAALPPLGKLPERPADRPVSMAVDWQPLIESMISNIPQDQQAAARESLVSGKPADKPPRPPMPAPYKRTPSQVGMTAPNLNNPLPPLPE